MQKQQLFHTSLHMLCRQLEQAVADENYGLAKKLKQQTDVRVLHVRIISYDRHSVAADAWSYALLSIRCRLPPKLVAKLSDSKEAGWEPANACHIPHTHFQQSTWPKLTSVGAQAPLLHPTLLALHLSITLPLSLAHVHVLQSIKEQLPPVQQYMLGQLERLRTGTTSEQQAALRAIGECHCWQQKCYCWLASLLPNRSTAPFSLRRSVCFSLAAGKWAKSLETTRDMAR